MKTKKEKHRDVPLATDGQEYARVVAMLGNNRVRARFVDGAERTCRIRGSMRKREWVHVGDIVLVAVRDLAGDTADIIFTYLAGDVQRLRRAGEPIDIAGDDDERQLGDVVVFEDERPADEDIEWDAV